MKKLLAILLALAMVLTLGACGSDKKDKDDKEDKGDKKGGSGYEQALDMALEYFFHNETKNVKKLIPEFMMEAWAEEEGMALDETYDYLIMEAEDNQTFHEDYGIEVEYTIEETEKLDADDLEELLEDVADVYAEYLSMDDFGDEGYYAYVTSEVYEEGELIEEGDYDVCMIQIDGGWYAVSDYGTFLVFGY